MDDQQLIKSVSNAVDLVFVPSEEQRRVKARLHARTEDVPLEYETITLARIIQITNDGRVERWMKQSGFKEWLMNRQEISEDMDYLINKGLACIDRLLESDDPKVAGAQINAVKILLEARGRMSARQTQIKFADAQIGNMSAAELKSYIAKQAKLVGV